MTGLEALNNLVQCCFNSCDSDEVLNDKMIVEKSLKALEIIKEKRVNVDLFWNDFVDNRFGYHYYLEKWYKYQSTDKQKLTEEEFELLKEVLE